MKKILILDRDGVINQDSDAFVKSAEEWIPLPGAIEAIAKLYKAGWTLAIATNQSGVARGKFSQTALDEQHTKMLNLIHAAGGDLHHIAWCPHGPDEGCLCRKPKAGLLDQISQALNLDLKGGVMVGDALRDLQAGQARGCQAVLVRTGKGEKTLTEGTGLEGVKVVADLADLAEQLLSNQPLSA